MQGAFKITYQIGSIDPNVLNRESAPVVIQLSAITGRATVSSGRQSVEIGTCGLLRFSQTLVYLCTMPLLYRTEESASAIGHGFDMWSSLEGDVIRLSFARMSNDPAVNFDIPPLQALPEVGRFHGELLRKFYNAVGDQRQYLKILQLFPLSSAKLIPQ